VEGGSSGKKLGGHSQLILAVLRRFDLDGRGCVSYPEFKKGMGYGQSRERVSTAAKARPKSAVTPMYKQLRTSKKKKVGRLNILSDETMKDRQSRGSPDHFELQNTENLTEIDRQFEMQ